MRILEMSEYPLIAGGNVHKQMMSVYSLTVVGTYTGFCGGLAATCALGLGPAGMVAAGIAAGYASLYIVSPDVAFAGGISGAFSGAGAALLSGPAMAAGTAMPMFSAGMLGGIIGMNICGAIWG